MVVLVSGILPGMKDIYLSIFWANTLKSPSTLVFLYASIPGRIIFVRVTKHFLGFHTGHEIFSKSRSRGTKHFYQKSFFGVRNISVIYQQFGGLLGILGSIIISMEEFIGVIGILGSSIRSLEEFRGVLGILASNY